MGLADDVLKVESYDVKKSKGRKKKEDDDGCWMKLSIFGSCISSRSKVDNSLSGITTHGK